MREHVLDAVASDDLRVYAVWLNQRVTDERGAIDQAILDDPRVRQYWDSEGITGTYFADNDLGGLGASGFVYDVFYVFDGDAAWHNDPGPVDSAGGPVLYEGEELLAALKAQL